MVRKSRNRVCAVFGCNFRKSEQPELKYHGFPRDPCYADLWVEKCNSPKNINLKNALICGEHFSDAQRIRNLKYELLKCKVPISHRTLKATAVPDLFLPSIPLAAQKKAEQRSKRIEKREHKKLVEKLLKEEVKAGIEQDELDRYSYKEAEHSNQDWQDIKPCFLEPKVEMIEGLPHEAPMVTAPTPDLLILDGKDKLLIGGKGKNSLLSSTFSPIFPDSNIYYKTVMPVTSNNLLPISQIMERSSVRNLTLDQVLKATTDAGTKRLKKNANVAPKKCRTQNEVSTTNVNYPTLQLPRVLGPNIQSKEVVDILTKGLILDKEDKFGAISTDRQDQQNSNSTALSSPKNSIGKSNEKCNIERAIRIGNVPGITNNLNINITSENREFQIERLAQPNISSSLQPNKSLDTNGININNNLIPNIDTIAFIATPSYSTSKCRNVYALKDNEVKEAAGPRSAAPASHSPTQAESSLQL